MSVFTSDVTETLPVPGDPDQTVTIRKLAPKHIRKAQRASQLSAMQMVHDMGGPKFMQELRESVATPTNGESVDDVVATAMKANPMMGFDQATILLHGITAWTYGRPVDEDAIDDLDDDTGEFFAEQIMRLSKPSLFLSAEDEEADRKND